MALTHEKFYWDKRKMVFQGGVFGAEAWSAAVRGRVAGGGAHISLKKIGLSCDMNCAVSETGNPECMQIIFIVTVI